MNHNRYTISIHIASLIMKPPNAQKLTHAFIQAQWAFLHLLP